MSESKRTEEKRRFTRVTFPIEVELVPEGASIIRGDLLDISLLGAFVICQARLSLGTLCTFQVSLIGGPSLSIQGTIIRDTPRGMALEFQSIDLDSYHHLQRLVVLNADNPEKVEQELSSSQGLRPRS